MMIDGTTLLELVLLFGVLFCDNNIDKCYESLETADIFSIMAGNQNTKPIWTAIILEPLYMSMFAVTGMIVGYCVKIVSDCYW